MKQFILYIILVLICGLGYSQTWQLDEKKLDVYELCDDTLTNADTISVVFPGTILNDDYYSVQLVADSLSGSTAATAYIQQSNSTGGEHYTTITNGSETINGVQTEKIWGKYFGFYWCEIQILRIKHGNSIN